MGRYKLDIYNYINESQLNKINAYVKILDTNDTLEIYIHDKSMEYDTLNSKIFRGNFNTTIIKDIERNNKTIKYIKLLKRN